MRQLVASHATAVCPPRRSSQHKSGRCTPGREKQSRRPLVPSCILQRICNTIMQRVLMCGQRARIHLPQTSSAMGLQGQGATCRVQQPLSQHPPAPSASAQSSAASCPKAPSSAAQSRTCTRSPARQRQHCHLINTFTRNYSRERHMKQFR